MAAKKKIKVRGVFLSPYALPGQEVEHDAKAVQHYLDVGVLEVVDDQEKELSPPEEVVDG